MVLFYYFFCHNFVSLGFVLDLFVLFFRKSPDSNEAVFWWSFVSGKYLTIIKTEILFY